MKEKKLDKRALALIKNYIKDSLNEIHLPERYTVDISNQGIEYLLKQLKILQKVLPDLNFGTLLHFYYSHIPEAYCSDFQHAGKLKEILSTDELNQISTHIYEVLSSLPTQYVFFLELPYARLDQAVNEELIPNVSLVKMNKEEVSHYGEQKRSKNMDLSWPLIKEDKIYLKILIKSFALDHESCPASIEIRKIIRELFTVLYVFTYIKKPFNLHNKTSSWSYSSISLVGYKVGSENEEPICISLPFEVEQFVSRVELDTTLFEKPLLPFKLPPNTSIVAQNLKPIYKLFSANNSNSNRIRASL